MNHDKTYHYMIESLLELIEKKNVEIQNLKNDTNKLKHFMDELQNQIEQLDNENEKLRER